MGRGGATKHVSYSKCRRKYYNGNAAENTNLDIFCGTWPQWYFHYNIFFGTCLRVYFHQHLVIRYFLLHYLYSIPQIIQRGDFWCEFQDYFLQYVSNNDHTEILFYYGAHTFYIFPDLGDNVLRVTASMFINIKLKFDKY